MNQKEKEEFLYHMIEKVKEIPVQNVVGSVVNLTRRGKYYFGLCPFHPDNHLGSFVVTPSKNLWRCFTDDIGGGPISFVMMYYEIPFLKACFKLALEYNIITMEEYVNYSRKKWNDDIVRTIQKNIEEKQKMEEKIASKEVIYMVYNAMAAVCDLSPKHKKHLLEERHLSEEELKDYFTFPTRRTNLYGKIMKYIEKRLRDKNMSEQKISYYLKLIENEFPYVPGFFKVKETGKIDFTSYRGIGFLIRDEEGHACGIQIRLDNPKGSRYIWFSSSFAQARDDYEGGASSGTPCGVIFPKNMDKAQICITEGKFKAVQIAKHGNTAIYVPGVTSWKKALIILNKIIKSQNKVYLIFDSDLMGNMSVYGQLESLANELAKTNKDTYVIVWSIQKGKGFDDLVIHSNDYKKDMKSLPFKKFKTIYEKELKNVLDLYGIQNIRDLKLEDRSSFIENLQSSVEISLGLREQNKTV